MIAFLLIAIPLFCWAVASARKAEKRRKAQLGQGLSELLAMDLALTPSFFEDPFAKATREAELAHLEATPAPVEPVEVPPMPETFDIQFKPDEPQSFDELTGQAHIVRPLAAAGGLDSSDPVVKLFHRV